MQYVIVNLWRHIIVEIIFSLFFAYISPKFFIASSSFVYWPCICKYIVINFFINTIILCLLFKIENKISCYINVITVKCIFFPFILLIQTIRHCWRVFNALILYVDESLWLILSSYATPVPPYNILKRLKWYGWISASLDVAFITFFVEYMFSS